MWFWHCHTDNLVRDAHLNKWLSLTSNENCLKKAKDWTNNTYPTDCHAVRKGRNPTGCTFSRRRRIRKYPLREVTIQALAHKGDSKGEIRYVIDVVWLDVYFAHDPQCPARGKARGKCRGKDHFENVCDTKWKAHQVGRKANVSNPGP